MHLFSVDIMTRIELVSLVEGILADARVPDLAEKFKQSIGITWLEYSILFIDINVLT